MDLLSKSDEEIFKLAKPLWENLVRASNMKDYGGFTKDFSTQMLFGANEVELGKQWANNKIITNLEETYKPFGTFSLATRGFRACWCGRLSSVNESLGVET